MRSVRWDTAQPAVLELGPTVKAGTLGSRVTVYLLCSLGLHSAETHAPR